MHCVRSFLLLHFNVSGVEYGLQSLYSAAHSQRRASQDSRATFWALRWLGCCLVNVECACPGAGLELSQCSGASLARLEQVGQLAQIYRALGTPCSPLPELVPVYSVVSRGARARTWMAQSASCKTWQVMQCDHPVCLCAAHADAQLLFLLELATPPLPTDHGDCETDHLGPVQV